MSEPYIGEIRLFGFDFPPNGWAKCDGAVLAINQYQALFSILGTIYGGDGRTTFALPDLRGRVPISFNSTYPQGQKSGGETVTLTTAQIPAHTHTVQANSSGASGTTPIDQVLAYAGGSELIYGDATNLVSLNTNTVGSAGGSQGIENMQPFLTIEFCIALTGLFPPRN